MDLIVTCLLNSTPDPQRGTTLAADWALLADLIHSVEGRPMAVISDCLDDDGPGNVELIRVDPDPLNVYFLRWRHIAQFLAGSSAARVWCVDGTDVTMLRDPFRRLAPGVLHIGSEPDRVDSAWMVGTNPDRTDWLAEHSGHALLNPGLVGGGRRIVAEFARRVSGMAGADMTDMGAANVVAHQLGFVTGSAIHTAYKRHADNGTAAWMHK